LPTGKCVFSSRRKEKKDGADVPVLPVYITSMVGVTAVLLTGGPTKTPQMAAVINREVL